MITLTDRAKAAWALSDEIDRLDAEILEIQTTLARLAFRRRVLQEANYKILSEAMSMSNIDTPCLLYEEVEHA